MHLGENRLPENFLSFAGHLEIFARHLDLLEFNSSSSPGILKFRRTRPAYFGKPGLGKVLLWHYRAMANQQLSIGCVARYFYTECQAQELALVWN